MGILINRLLILLNETSANSTYYYIALTILKHFPKMRSAGINEIAKLCVVSKSTISKFIREIGYRDYADFRNALEFEDNRYRARRSFVHDVIGYLEDHSFEEYAQLLAADLTANALDEKGLDRLAQDLVDYENVVAVGLMFSGTAGVDLQTKLGRVGKFIRTNLNDLKQYQCICNADEHTLVIVFSESGSFMDRCEMIDRETGKSIFELTKAKLVMITANERMAQDRRLSYIIKMCRTNSVHTHRITYPLLTDILTFKYFNLVNQ